MTTPASYAYDNLRHVDTHGVVHVWVGNSTWCDAPWSVFTNFGWKHDPTMLVTCMCCFTQTRGAWW